MLMKIFNGFVIIISRARFCFVTVFFLRGEYGPYGTGRGVGSSNIFEGPPLPRPFH
jgi:hypothetical protein